MFQNEMELIELFKTMEHQFGYNHSVGGESGSKGSKHQRSEEYRQKQRIAQKGKHDGERSPNFGKHLSNETKQKISEALTGRKVSDELREKMRKDRLGKCRDKTIIGVDGVVYENIKTCRMVLGITQRLFYKKVQIGELKYA